MSRASSSSKLGGRGLLPASVPDHFEGRRFYEHNEAVTLMRTTPEECAELGRRIAAKLRGATAPTIVMVPRGGISALSVPGGPLEDRDADEALFAALREGIESPVELVELDVPINDPVFAAELVDRLVAVARISTDSHLN